MVEPDTQKPKSTEDDSVESDDEFVRSRTSLKKERVNNERALTELSTQLLELSPGQLPGIGVSDSVIEALDALRKIKTFAARGRQLRLVRARLRDQDWMQIRINLDQRRAGFIQAPANESGTAEARRWTEQLLIQKDDGLTRFVHEYEHVNRTRLRQLIVNVSQAGEAKRHKARKVLLAAVQEVLNLNEVPASSGEDQ